MAPDIPEWAVVFHAAALAGGISTPVNPACTEAEAHGQLHDSGAQIVVTIRRWRRWHRGQRQERGSQRLTSR